MKNLKGLKLIHPWLLSAKLLQIKRLERIDIGADGVFVHELRLDRGPPVVVGGFEFVHYVGVSRGDVAFLTGVDFDIKKLPLLFA
jgi:hypothetical protein